MPEIHIEYTSDPPPSPADAARAAAAMSDHARGIIVTSVEWTGSAKPSQPADSAAAAATEPAMDSCAAGPATTAATDRRAIALLVSTPTTGLSATSARLNIGDAAAFRRRIDDLRHRDDLPHGDAVQGVAVFGRPGRRPLLLEVSCTRANMQMLQDILLDLDA